MKGYLVFFALLLTLTGSVRPADGHGIPIDVLANSTTNRLFVIEGFEPATLELQSGVAILSDSPGIGVNFPENGIIEGTTLDLEIDQGLLYWDGTGLANPASDTKLIVYNPQLDINHSYTVTETSGEQTGLQWATYSGASAWHADGLYQLDPLTAAEGIYGLAFRIAGTGYQPTKPFLLPLIYDPAGQWNAAEINAGIEALRGAIEVPFSANFDGDDNIDGIDFLSWQRNFGPPSPTTLPSEGDADLDSDVDRFDFAYWEQTFGDQFPAGFVSATAIPEPGTMYLALVALLGLLSFTNPFREYEKKCARHARQKEND